MIQRKTSSIGLALCLLWLGAPVLRAEKSEISQPAPQKAETDEEDSDLIRERILLYLQRHGDDGRIDPERRRKSVAAEYARRRVEEASRRLSPLAASADPAWVSLGPTNGAGRVTAVAPHPTATGTVYIGAAGGGVWKTTDAGATWTSLTDGINDLSVGALAVAPSSPNTIYLGTGEGGYAIDFIPGIGLLTSTDGGANWSLPSSVLATTFYRISVHPTNAQELVVGTNAGGFRSTDGGATWQTVIGHSTYGDVSDIVRHPTDPLTLYAATWCATGCGNGISKILKSTDGGATWVDKSVGLPVSGSTNFAFNERIALAISATNPLVLYAATGQTDSTGDIVSHIYKTTNGGDSWSDLPAISGNSSSAISHYMAAQSWYNNTIVVSPSDPNVVLAGGTNYVRSMNGGTNFSAPPLSGFNQVHVDAHDMRYQGSTLYIGNDGGVWSSGDDGQSATDRNTGLVIRQFYALANDPVNRNRILAGAQDNGTGQRQDAGGTSWRAVVGSDGFECGVNPIAPSFAYASVQQGSIRRSKNAGGASPGFTLIAPLYASGEVTPFLSILTIDPVTPSTLYTGSYRVWKSDNGGDSWIPLPTKTTDGSTWTTGNSIMAIAVSRSDPSVLLVGKRRANPPQNVFRSTDGGLTWVLTSGGLPASIVNNLEIDPVNPLIAYAVFARTSGPSLYWTTDGGATWSARATGLPSFAGQVVRVDPSDSNVLYCGTDVGVYRSADQGASWQKFGTGLPNSSVHDLRVLDDGSILRIATHGRGVWELALPPPSNTAPVAAITTPTAAQTVPKGTKIDFSGTVLDPDAGDSATALWSFSDTWETVVKPAGASTVSHVFTRPGVYPVTLAARDSHGALAAASVTISVLESADDCAAAIVLPGAGPFPYSSFTSSETATQQASDPSPSCRTAGAFASLWFAFTPSVSGTYEFSTCGTAVDTVLSVYTGPACGPYTEVAGGCNDEAPTSSICPGTHASLVKVAGNAGETLRILVSGFVPSSIGLFALTVRPVTVPDFVPRATGVSRAAGPASGGTSLTLSGASFADGATVSFGGIPGKNVVFLDSGNINVTAPAHAAGPVAIVVTNPDGTQGTLAGAFTYTPSSGGGPCVAGSTVLCLNGGRFRVSITWRAPALKTEGVGMAVPLTGDTGYFWFFSSNNVELVLKAVDGRAFNNKFWVFYGALSDVEYVITVTDTVTGAVQAYFNPNTRLASVADTAAFDGSVTDQPASLAAQVDRTATIAPVAQSSSTVCPAGPSALCLNASRFLVQVAWRVPSQGTSGVGMAVPLTTDTGYLWFFSSNNVELVIKVVDGRAFNSHFWVFYGALSNVEYTITVTDTQTGAVKTYVNLFGTLASVADTAAF